jgi:hypothetical protein
MPFFTTSTFVEIPTDVSTVVEIPTDVTRFSTELDLNCGLQIADVNNRVN